MLSHQQFLWEHAVLLFYNYEWRASEELFSVVSESLEPEQDRLRCAVNRALLHARLGDLSAARTRFQEAIQLDVPSIVARCGLAEVEAILGNIRQARYWYTSCLELFSGHLRADELYHFGYCPSREVLEANIKNLSTSTGIKDDLANARIGFERIPAGCIFIPSSDLGLGESTLTTLDDERPRSTTTSTQRKARPGADRHTDGELPTILEDPEPSSMDRKSMPTLGREQPITRKQVSSPAMRARPKLEARDARTRSESVKELSEFLRNAGPAGNQQYLVDHKYLMDLLSKAGMGLKNGEQHQDGESAYDALMEDFLKK